MDAARWYFTRDAICASSTPRDEQTLDAVLPPAVGVATASTRVWTSVMLPHLPPGAGHVRDSHVVAVAERHIRAPH
jgi:hypothetical protein